MKDSIFAEVFGLLPDSVYYNPVNIKKFWELLSKQLSEVESILEDLRLIHDPNHQHGEILDLIGELRHERRDGHDDNAYRSFLFIAIKKLLCGGSVPELQKILKEVAGDDFLYIIDSDYAQEEGSRLQFDGSWRLNGKFRLTGNARQTGHFIVMIKQSTPGRVYNYIDRIMQYIKPAGRHYKIRLI